MMQRTIILLLILGLFGCSKESSGTGPTQEGSLEKGWKDFEEKRYDSAILNFTDAQNSASTASARAEAVGGRAWSYAYKRDLAKAENDFTTALAITGITTDVHRDLRVGFAFVLYATDDFLRSISYASSVLFETPSYNFSHDPRVTTKRVRLLLAQSYYASGMFVSAAGEMDLIDPAGAPHSSDPKILLGTILAALDSL